MPSPRIRTGRARFARSPVAWAAAGLLQGLPAWAQTPPDIAAPVQLRPSSTLRETIPETQRDQLPTFVEGDRITGRPELDTRIDGNARLRRGDTFIRADRLDYDQPTDQARARGNVRINKAGDVFEGPELELKIEAFEGFFTQPRYKLLRNGAYGEASRVDFLDPDRAVVRTATYTTCEREPGPSWTPAWQLTADTLELDQAEEVGYATGAVVRFFGVPVLPAPSMSFPLSDKRKTGFLPPTIGLNNVSGVEYTQPWYWNIAPNRDATLYPTLMTKRGASLGAEFRYLEPGYRGLVSGNFMPNDRLRDANRWAYTVRHNQALRTPWPGASALSLSLNRVSDDNYWRDFTHSALARNGSLTQRLLANDAVYTWADGGLSVTARALSWQTLQDVNAPIVPPYDRLPQLMARHGAELPGGLESFVEADHTRFRSDRLLNNQPNADRSHVLAQLSRTWRAPGWFVTPKVQLHSRRYEFDAPLAGTGQRTADVSVPTFSADSGLVFEREVRLLGRDLLQTLEPRLFYVHTPFRDQNRLPNYDSAATDFNFATVYTENAFSGNDRIADNNLLTGGVTTRFLSDATGAEVARFGVAQRVRFKDQRVVLPGGATVSDRLSDVLVGGSVNWVPEWMVDATVQYNPKTRRSIRTTLGGRWNPGPYRVVSAAYRLQRDLSEQLDIGWQWPLSGLFGGSADARGGRWYSVGRINISLKDRRAVDTILGLEYDGCCWVGRIVFERLQAGTTFSNKRLLFQLEFIGFTRLGSNAVGTLRQNIPRYQFLRDQVEPPSRYTSYD